MRAARLAIRRRLEVISSANGRFNLPLVLNSKYPFGLDILFSAFSAESAPFFSTVFVEG